MSQQGPILVVAHAGRPAFATAVDAAKLFPVVDAGWTTAARAIAQVGPAAIIADAAGASEAQLAALAGEAAGREPYLPLIVVDPTTRLPANALPSSQACGGFDPLIARLRSSLRVRSLHTTVMRRSDRLAAEPLPKLDLTREATALLVGRGAAYPALSVALGQQIGVVGALSIEAAAKHLSARDIDGIVLGDGFSTRVIDAFLTVLAEDARFRNLPVIVTSEGSTAGYDLPNLEIIPGKPALVAANAMPLIRQRAFEAQLSRILRSIDAGGLLDPASGLLTQAAFERDFATAVYQTLSRGGGLSIARFTFDPRHPRAQLDGARIIGRLMRQMDFGALRDDGSVLVVFAETDLRTAHAIARRLSSVMRHTSHGKRDRSEPTVSIATLVPSDTAASLLSRLCAEAPRVAS
jgi:hypothetical protein